MAAFEKGFVRNLAFVYFTGAYAGYTAGPKVMNELQDILENWTNSFAIEVCERLLSALRESEQSLQKAI